MKTTRYLFLPWMAGILFFTSPVISQGQTGPDRNAVPDYIRTRKAFQRLEWFQTQRAWPAKAFPARMYTENKLHAIAQAREKDHLKGDYPNWTCIGPYGTQHAFPGWSLVSGRVRAVAVHPTDPQTVYIGAASGGLWKTTDGGETWTDVGGTLETQNFGAIAIDPVHPDIVYAGSGECNLLENFNTYPGNGLYKSTDGGQNWTLITNGFGNVTFFSNLAICPQNPDILIASLGGGTPFSGVFLPNEGVWKSTDAGITWNRVLDRFDASDVAFHPTDPNTVYATAGGYMATIGGFFISHDQGATWTASNAGMTFSDGGGRLQFDISKSNPNIIYIVLYDLRFDPGNGITKAYKSTDGGSNWTRISPTTNLGGNYGDGWLDQGWYDLCIAVDPVDPDHVLIGNIELHATTNGTNFAPVRPYGSNAYYSICHVDYHALVFAPSDPNILYIGCDGGIYKSTNNGQTAFSIGLGLPTMQFYRIASHPTNAAIVAGGTQDNGTSFTFDGGASWTVETGGDGMECFFAPNPTNIYTTQQYGVLLLSSNAGSTFSFIATVNGAWVTPFMIHPDHPNIMFSATKNILKSVNSGYAFNAISGPGTVAPSLISTMAQSQVNPSYMIFGTGLDHPHFDTVFVVKISTNEGITWTDVTANIPGESRWIARVVTDPVDQNTMYVVKTGFSPGNKVYKTTNLGQYWTNISGNLPDLPCNDLWVDPENTSHLFLANDIGVYISTDGGVTWNFGSYGMPWVPAMDFDYVKIGATRYLRVGTHGRSIYVTNPDVGVGIPVRPAGNIPSAFGQVSNYPNPTTGTAILEYELQRRGMVTIELYDHLGIHTASLYEGFRETGRHQLRLDGLTLSPGVYFCRLRSGNETVTRKMIIGR